MEMCKAERRDSKKTWTEIIGLQFTLEILF